MQKYHQVFLLLGSNQGNKKELIEKAVSHISEVCGEIVTKSSYYLSESWGYDDDDYLNLAIEIWTLLTAEKLLKLTQDIEEQLGRKKKTTKHYEARPIDIDILFFDTEMISTTKLTIPHPRLHLRNFVLLPLQEIAPNLEHPSFRKTIKQLAKESPDRGKVYQKL